MKKHFFAFFTILFIATSFLSAQEKYKFSKPGKKEVMCIGKIVLNTQVNPELVKRRYNLNEEIQEQNSNFYRTPVFVDDDGEIEDFNINSNGAFFATTCEFPTNNIIVFYKTRYYLYCANIRNAKKDFHLEIVNPFSNNKPVDKVYLNLPLNFQFKGEEDVQYAYVGSFYYDIDPETWEVLKVTMVDEYEEAVEWLDKNFPNKKGDRQLVRVELQ